MLRPRSRVASIPLLVLLTLGVPVSLRGEEGKPQPLMAKGSLYTGRIGTKASPPPAERSCTEGEIAFLSGAFAKAAASFSRCARVASSFNRFHFHFWEALSRARIGEFGRARLLLAAIPPNLTRLYPLARFHLAEILLAEGKAARAILALHELIDTPGVPRCLLLTHLAEGYEMVGDPWKSAEYREQLRSCGVETTTFGSISDGHANHAAIPRDQGSTP
ncbi:MAG: hypothetical protein D6812_11825 [Deltaproteobacteria bacterium]|nr:MAG: hypothetical protein D6812_11825 [Deltaproteobacteria bacterium]